MKLAMSPAASGLLRALLERGGISRDRILLTSLRSTDWQSLTLMGERHCLSFRIPGPGAPDIVDRLTNGIEEAEFRICGQIVADISLRGPPRPLNDGSIELTFEALTVTE